MPVRLRGLQKSDIAPIEKILKALAPVFSDVEVKVAVEMLEEHLGVVEGPDTYRVLVAAEEDGRVVGYALFGRTPLTNGTWDVYWIAADPTSHGKGVGPKLLRALEDVARKEGGRLVMIETSSRADYARARRFYERQGYAKAAVLTDYYKDTDHKIIYSRRIDRPD